jgi:hypothetical protein
MADEPLPVVGTVYKCDDGSGELYRNGVTSVTGRNLPVSMQGDGGQPGAVLSRPPGFAGRTDDLAMMGEPVAESQVMQDRVEPHLSSIMRAMPDAIVDQAMSNSPDRAETLVQIRAELRDNHPRLTDVQIDLIADVAVDLRLAQIRLGLVAERALPSAPPIRARVAALV